MASYSATIEVGTRGTAALEKLLARVNTLSGSIDKVNRNPVFGSKQVASLNEYNRTLKEATANLAKTRVVLDKSGQAAGNYAKAIKDYVDALGLANGAQDLSNKLVQQEIQGREKATAALKKYNAAAASARQVGGSMTGSYLRGGGGVSRTGVASGGSSQYSSPIGPDPSFVFSGQSTAVGGRIKAIKAAQAAMVAAETEVNRVTRTFEQQETAREKANDKLTFDRKMALLDAEHQKTLKLNKKENDAALKNFDQRLSAQTKKRAAQAKAQAGRSRKFTDIATGAGFPLLFGGGPIQALAGGLGGAAGGLGGAIAASAITAQVEAFAKDTAAVGQSLNSTSGALELMREKSLFSKDATKELAAELEGLGEIEKLSTLLTTELVQKIGNEGVTALQDLGTESDKTTRLWSALTLQLQALIAGPLKDFFALINSVLGAVTTSGQFKVLESELTGQARTDFDADVASRRAANLATTASGATGASGMMSSMGTAGGVGVLSPADQRELVEKYLPKLQVTADIPDLGGIKPPKTKKGPKERESRLPQLQAEVALQERLAVLSRQVVKAKEEENPVREAALNMEIALEKQATAIDKINLEKITAAEKFEKTKLVELATDERILAIKDKVKAAEASRAEKASETMDGLQQQKDLLEARLNGTEKEVAFKQELEKLTKDMTPEEAARTEQLLRGVAATEEQVKALAKLESMYAAIGQSISSGIVDALSAAVEGTKSLADVASQTLRQVANILLQFGVNTALGGIPGLGSFFGGGKAAGGPVSGGTPYMVGEKGPELFVPNASGTIVPNNKLGSGGGGNANVTVNVDASGSNVQGNQPDAKALGSAIGAAVQAELIKQKRPGGLLSV